MVMYMIKKKGQRREIIISQYYLIIVKKKQWQNEKSDCAVTLLQQPSQTRLSLDAENTG